MKSISELKQHWLYQNSTNSAFSELEAWMYLHINSCTKPELVLYRKHHYELSEGQVIIAENELVKNWRWSRPRVRKFLKDLETEHLIILDRNHHRTIITLATRLILTGRKLKLDLNEIHSAAQHPVQEVVQQNGQEEVQEEVQEDEQHKSLNNNNLSPDPIQDTLQEKTNKPYKETPAKVTSSDTTETIKQARMQNLPFKDE